MTLLTTRALAALCAVGAAAAMPQAMLTVTVGKTVTLNSEGGASVVMPSQNLGTCCGSDPTVGLKPWLLEARKVMGKDKVGIDTAWDYSDQTNIGKILKETNTARDSIFVTTKIPTGFGNATDCNADPSIVTRYMQENLAQLGLDYVDLALLHHPCDKSSRPHPTQPEPTIDSALWAGMVTAQKKGWAKAIGVSNYKAAQLKTLKGPTPAVNQCSMGVSHHDDETIAYCAKAGIQYEAYGTMRSCYGKPFTPKLQGMASKLGVSVAQVCLRWVLQSGAVMAIGTGSDAASIGNYTREDLDVYGFSLSAAQMQAINAM